jgi:peptidoglycan/LPS O-acetylase OafA/YrhL
MQTRVAGLDLLRAGAILLVLLAHGSLLFQPFALAFRHCLMAGPFGVDLFFALSGWLIGGILLDLGDRLTEPRMFAGFWLNRALRTLPEYYLFLAVNIGIWFWREGEVPDFGRHLIFAQNLLGRPPTFFLEAWSLGVEEWFYLLFPLGLWLGLQTGANFRRVYGLAVLAMMIVPLALRAAMPPSDYWALEVNMVTVHKFDAIGWGVGAVAIARSWPALVARCTKPAAWLGLVLLVGCYWYASQGTFEDRGPLGNSVLGRVWLPALVPLGWALQLPWASQLKNLGNEMIGRAVAAVARWSYALYLVNFAVFQVAFIQLKIFYFAGVGGAVARAIFFLVASLALSAALHRWFEVPVLRWRERLPWCRAVMAARRPVRIPSG